MTSLFSLDLSVNLEVPPPCSQSVSATRLRPFWSWARILQKARVLHTFSFMHELSVSTCTAVASAFRTSILPRHHCSTTQVLKLHSEFGTGGGCTRPRLDQIEADVADWDERIKRSEETSPQRQVAGMVSDTLHQALFWLRDEMWSLTPVSEILTLHEAACLDHNCFEPVSLSNLNL